MKLIDIGAISSTYSNTNLGTGEVHKSEHSIVRTLSNISKDDIIENNKMSTQLDRAEDDEGVSTLQKEELAKEKD